MNSARTRRRIVWINPLIHPVYTGWLAFFRTDGTLTTYAYEGSFDSTEPVKRLIPIRLVRFIHTTVGIYRRPHFKESSFVIIGDIFTNSLAWTIRVPHSVYYTEYFSYESRFIKRFLECFAAWRFRNKPFIVPTRHAEQFVTQFSKNVVYLPQLWDGSKARPLPHREGKPRVLFVGLCSDWKKNVPLLLDTIAKNPTLVSSIGLCGRLGSFDTQQYTASLRKKLHIHGAIPHERLGKIYRSYDVLVLPSVVDPIGAVVLEAMAHGLPVIVSKTAGASSYITHEKNGFVIEPTAAGIRDAIGALASPQRRAEFSIAAASSVNENHWIGNAQLIRRLWENLERVVTR